SSSPSNPTAVAMSRSRSSLLRSVSQSRRATAMLSRANTGAYSAADAMGISREPGILSVGLNGGDSARANSLSTSSDHVGHGSFPLFPSLTDKSRFASDRSSRYQSSSRVVAASMASASASHFSRSNMASVLAQVDSNSFGGTTSDFS